MMIQIQFLPVEILLAEIKILTSPDRLSHFNFYKSKFWLLLTDFPILISTRDNWNLTRFTFVPSHKYTYRHTLPNTYTFKCTHVLVIDKISTDGWWWSFFLTHTHTHTYTHSLANTHTYTHSRTHTYIHTLSRTHTYTHSLAHTHTYTHTYIHTLSRTHTYIHTHIHTHTLSHTHIHTHTLSHTHIHTHTLSHTHTAPSEHWGHSTVTAHKGWHQVEAGLWFLCAHPPHALSLAPAVLLSHHCTCIEYRWIHHRDMHSTCLTPSSIC